MRALLACVVALVAAAASAQPVPSLFVLPDRANAASSADQRGAVTSSVRVGMRLDALFEGRDGAAARITLNAAPESWIARMERLDTDVQGFRSWVGGIEGIPESHVVFTERAGVVSGLINAVGTTYQIRTEQPGSYLLERVNVALLGDEREPLDPGPGSSRLASPAEVARDDASTFDVLLLYTASARDRVGGTAQMQALAAQVISDTNTAFSRSGVLARVRPVGVFELNFVEAAQMTADLPALKASPEAQLLRDVVRADLVQLLVSSPDQASCGVAYLLSVHTPDFDAYSIADVSCAAQYTPTHELAHNMGAHHAPEDGASGALFPYSYAYKDPERGFRTIMAYPCAGVTCDRILNFSNPTVDHNGGATGTSLQDNARTINEAASYVANFRTAGGTTAVPAAPSGLQSVVTGNLVTVTWNPVASGSPAAVSYVLQAGSAPGASNLFHASVGIATTASGALPPGIYYWRVLAVSSAGFSPPSAEAQFVVGGCEIPVAPLDFRFSINGRTVSLSWSAAPTGSAPTTYVLEAGSSPTLANLLVANVGLETVVVTTAPPGTYYVRVRARNACGTSAPSNEQIIVVP
jgi:hypothetical protein